MTTQKMEFLFGDRVLQLHVLDILKAPVDVIVNPANGSLVHAGGLALHIQNAAGSMLQQQSQTLINEYGQLESGMAVFTTAGNLPYNAVIHAVGPQQGEGHEASKLEQVFLRSLLLCETNDWSSIAFPAISTGIFRVPIDVCAKACFKAITHFWDARSECVVEKIIICLTKNNFQSFFDAFREESFDDSSIIHQPSTSILQQSEDTEEKIGTLDLKEADSVIKEDDEVNDWFK